MPTFYTTGMEHSPTSATGTGWEPTPWHATQRAAWEAVRKVSGVAIWAADIELMRTFYEKYFDARSNSKYENERKRFTSYFLTFPGGGRLELMHRADIQRIPDSQRMREFIGYAHLGVELGTQAAVDALTKRLQGDGFRLLDGPRRTGDGYYESMVADPEGNRIVIAE